MAADARFNALPPSSVPDKYRAQVLQGDRGDPNGIMRTTALGYMAADASFNALPPSSVPEDIRQLFQDGIISAHVALRHMGERHTYAKLVGEDRVPAGLLQLVIDNEVSVSSALKAVALLAACARLCAAADARAIRTGAEQATAANVAILMDTDHPTVAVHEAAPAGVAAADEAVPTLEVLVQDAIAQGLVLARARNKAEWATYPDAVSQKLYYHNAERGVTQWERPECLDDDANGSSAV
jgi:hypothetical protein